MILILPMKIQTLFSILLLLIIHFSHQVRAEEWNDSENTFRALHKAKTSIDITVGPTEPQPEGSFIPGGQAGLILYYQGSDVVLERFILLGSQFNLHLLAGRPTVRLRVDWDSPGFLLKELTTSSYLYYTPIVLRGLLTHHVTDGIPGADGLDFGNSFGFGSTRFGIRGISNIQDVIVSGGFELGPEGGYIKDRGGQAPFAGFVAATKLRVFSPQIFWGMGAEGHLNVLRAFDFDSIAQHAISGNMELGIPFTSISRGGSVLFSMGLRAQVDYFDMEVKNDPQRNAPNGLSIYGGLFLRWEAGDLY